MHKLIDLLGWVLLFIFLGLVIATAIRFNDFIILILGLIVFATGVSAKRSISYFNQTIKEARELTERLRL